MKKAFALLSVALTIVALTACGDGGASAEDNGSAKQAGGAFDLDEPHPGSAVYGSPPLEFEADPGGELAYTTDEVTAKEGNVTIEFTNPQPVAHNVAIEAASGARVETKTVADGFTAVTITLNSKEKFIFYCTVPGHRKAGMEGTVKVEKSG